MKYLFFTLLFASTFMTQKNNSIKQFQWLVGNWKLDGKEVYEKWQMVSDTLLGGVGYHFIKEEHDEDETDIIFDESMRLVMRESKYYYIPMVRNQNDGKEVEFEITSLKKNSFVAENLKHDFPQKIVYEIKEESVLHCYIEGKQHGKKKRMDYRFAKTK